MSSTPTSHPTKQIIEASYDRMAPAYLTWTSQKPSPRTEYIHKLLALLPPAPPRRPAILELGCGAGLPGTQLLAQHVDVTANDISAAQIALARANVSAAAAPVGDDASTAAAAAVTFIQSDMMALHFAPSTFDAAVALYSLIHLPRDEQVILIQRLHAWVKPGGWLLVNLGTRDDAGSWNEHWVGGQRMWWSGWDEPGNRRMLEDGGWRVVEGAVRVDEEVDAEGEGGVIQVPFLWVLAQRGGEGVGE